MQSETSEVIQNVRTNLAADTQNPRRHGFSTQDEHAQDLSLHGTSLGEASSSTDTARSSNFISAVRHETADDTPVDTMALSFRSLSSASSSSTLSPVDRIIEYENAFVAQRVKREKGSTFTVVSYGNAGPSSKTSLTDFPNEVLNHIFSFLTPRSLLDASLVSHRFHCLVTTPHAWKAAFARYFPGAQALTKDGLNACVLDDLSATLLMERRIFTRLTAHASWRHEYILRTGLLQSLDRGRPADTHGDGGDKYPRPFVTHKGNAQVTFNSNLVKTVNHLHAAFRNKDGKRFSVIHGADEDGSACLSHPTKGEVAKWGFADPRSFSQFVERFPGFEEYGLGYGRMVGVPNVMSVSQPYGMVYAEGFPGGSLYHRSTNEHRGRTLAIVPDMAVAESGIPRFYSQETICSVWIAKTSNMTEVSGDLVGILTGSAQGIVSSYSLGTLREGRLKRGEVTSRWVLSPGVPIIALAVDDSYSVERQKSRRIWAVALNALGEVYYLDELPLQLSPGRSKLDANSSERLAWRAGRSVYWKLIEVTKRTIVTNPYGEVGITGDSPRTSWDARGLSPQQISDETGKIETLMQQKPRDFREWCSGWDMRRKLEVDFGASHAGEGGEAIVVANCGFDSDQSVAIKRFTRCKMVDPEIEEAEKDPLLNSPTRLDEEQPTWSFNNFQSSKRSSAASHEIPGTDAPDDWRTAVFELGVPKSTKITTMAIDMSTFALLTLQEDPILSMDASSGASTPSFFPQGQRRQSKSPSVIPGQRGRFLAIGTNHGTVIVWNLRASSSPDKMPENIILPVRIIQTDSPEISCLALSALYLVHGGNDGLVQAWDPLASVTGPIRTLNSRYLSRTRRTLIQGRASPIANHFTAGAVYLDPDPTVLRGIVSLGANLRYWSYSVSVTDQGKGKKRRSRRTQFVSDAARKSSNHVLINDAERIFDEDEQEKRKEVERLASRFGLGLLGPGASEDEILAYAKLLSEESVVGSEQTGERLASRFGLGLLGPDASEDEILAYAKLLSEESVIGSEQKGEGSRSNSNDRSSGGEDEAALHQSDLHNEDADVAEAMRLSLQERHSGYASDAGEGMSMRAPAFTIRYVKARKSSPTSPRKGKKKSIWG